MYQICHDCNKVREEKNGIWTLWEIRKLCEQQIKQSAKVRCDFCDRKMFEELKKKLKDLNLDKGG